MINRRIVRIKVMQSLYACKQNEESDWNMAFDKLEDDFFMELNVVGKDKKAEIDEQKELALTILRSELKGERPPEGLAAKAKDSKASDIVYSILNQYHLRRVNDRKSQKRFMDEEVGELYLQFLKMLKFLLYLGEESKIEGLQGNALLHCLAKNWKLQNLFDRFAITLPHTDLNRWMGQLRKDAELLEVLRTEEEGFEADRTAVRLLCRDFILKNEVMESYFEELSIRWEENKKILKGLLITTVKSVEQDQCEDADIFDLSRNWDDDRDFMIRLFDCFFEEEPLSESLIVEKSQKWAADRIALLDQILIKMAVAEMRNFPSIPVKVTINEYIDISKVYSTPKSWKFVNGMLDEISKKLKAEGKIKKSGRGLIDNK